MEKMSINEYNSIPYRYDETVKDTDTYIGYRSRPRDTKISVGDICTYLQVREINNSGDMPLVDVELKLCEIVD